MFELAQGRWERRREAADGSDISLSCSAAENNVYAAMQVYDTAECCTGRLYYSVMILRMYAIDSITILYS